MPRPFRFGVVEAHAPSRTAWVTIARRVEELGYATLLIPDRMNVGSLAPTAALAVAASVTTSDRKSTRLNSSHRCSSHDGLPPVRLQIRAA